MFTDHGTLVPEAPEEREAVGAPTADPRKQRGRIGSFFGFNRIKMRPKKRGRVILALAAFWVLLTILLAIFADLLPIQKPNLPIGAPNAAPLTDGQIFGLDAVGRSILSRLIFGARISYLIAISVTVMALAIGSMLGLVAVYFRGIAAFIADVICNTLLSVPGLLFLLTLAVIFHASLLEIILAITVVFVPAFTRLTRAVALSQIEREYVTVARGMGASSRRVIFRELLPNTLTSLVTFACIALPAVMIVEGTLSYLGYGVPTPTASWGQMIAQGQTDISQYPWPALIPAIVYALTVFAVYVLGDWLRGRVDLKGLDNL